MTVSLLFISSALFSVRLLLLILLHVLPGGVNPVRGTVSDYAVAETKTTRSLATAASWAAAIAWISLGSAILLHSKGDGAGHGVGFGLLVLGLLLAAMPLVPTDRTGSQTTVRGRVHLLFAIAWFTLAYSTIGPLARLISSSLTQAFGVIHFLAAITLAALVVSLVVRPLRSRTFGIAERAFILVVTIAPLIASVNLFIQW